MKAKALLSLAIATGLTAGAQAAQTVSGNVLADDYYQIYVGTDSNLRFVGEVTSTWGSHWSNNWSFATTPGDYLYIVAWDTGAPHAMTAAFTLFDPDIGPPRPLLTNAVDWVVAQTFGLGRPNDTASLQADIFAATQLGGGWETPVESNTGYSYSLSGSPTFIWYQDFNDLGPTNLNTLVFRTAAPVDAASTPGAVPEPETVLLLLVGAAIASTGKLRDLMRSRDKAILPSTAMLGHAR